MTETASELYPDNPPINLPTDPSYLRPTNLYAFEGLDGSGKSTIVRQVVERCRAGGHSARRLKLTGAPVLGGALENAKRGNVDPMTFNLLNWASLFNQTTLLQDDFNGDELLFFDRYSLTVRTRGLIEGMDTAFMDLVEAQLSQPVAIFLIDCDPNLCLKRLLAGGRQITYFEGGARDVDGPGQPMRERDPSERSPSATREQGLLEHLERMRRIYRELARGRDHVHVISNEGTVDEALERVFSILNLQGRGA